MKNAISMLLCSFLLAVFTCGYGQLDLSFTAKYHDHYYPLDSIIIENINTGSKIIKYYPDTLLQLTITHIDDLIRPVESGFTLSQNRPNPFEDKTNFNIYLPQNDLLTITVCNILGQELLHFERNLPAGRHSFTFSGSNEKIYFLTAKTRHYSAGIKMVNCGGEIYGSGINLEHNGSVSVNDEYSERNGTLKNNKNEFEYHPGDYLKMTGFITNDTGAVFSDTIIHRPTQSKTYSFQYEKTDRIIILMYHEIVDGEPGSEYERNLADFEDDLFYIRNNYQVISMNDLLLIETGELELSSDAVVITFDDGFGSDYIHAFPLLSQYDMPAAFFIVPEWIDSSDYMTWSGVWGISQYPGNDGERLFKIGSHTSSHPYLEQSSQFFTDHQDYLNFLYTELGDSKNWIVDFTGQADIFLSLPFGDGAYNEDIINTAKYCGYKGIRTSIMNSFTVDEMNLIALPAVAIMNNTSIDIIETFLNY